MDQRKGQAAGGGLVMYEELVKRLKQTWEICGWYDLKEAAETIEKLQSDCADRNRWKQIAEVQDKRIDELENKMHDSFTEHLLNQISRKEKQIEDLKATCKKECEARQRQADIIQDLKGTIYQQISKIDEKSKLEKELEVVEEERDAAIKDMRINNKCSICLFREIPLTECRHYNECGLTYKYFQWRGPQD